MIPLADHNPTRLTPLLNWGLIAACVVAFLWQLGNGLPFEQTVGEYGFIPERFFGAGDPDYHWPTSAGVTILTSMFMHGGWAHLGGNMLYLYIFGDNIENAMGRVRYILFYVAGGAAAALAQGLMDVHSIVPMVGASGAISAVLGAYLVLYPRQRITMIGNYGSYEMEAIYVLGLWFVYQFVFGLMGSGEGGGVAFFAHVGGFVFGLLTVKIFTLGRDTRPPAPPAQLWQR